MVCAGVLGSNKPFVLEPGQGPLDIPSAGAWKNCGLEKLWSVRVAIRGKSWSAVVFFAAWW